MDFKPVDEDHPIAIQLTKSEQVSRLGRDLLDEHGLEDWQFRIATTIRTLGRCFYKSRTIEFSANYLHISDSEIRDTILHEIAHALSYLRYGEEGKGHNHLWRLCCKEVGARPQRLAPPTAKSSARPSYRIKCPVCDWSITRFRMRRRNFGALCPKCHSEVKIYRITYKEGE